MHEVSLAYKIMETIKLEAGKNGLRRVYEVIVSHGGGAGFDPGLVREALGLMQADSFLSGAEIAFVPGKDHDFRVERIRGE